MKVMARGINKKMYQCKTCKETVDIKRADRLMQSNQLCYTCKENYKYWWQRIQKLYEGNNLGQKYIENSTDLPSYSTITYRFGNKQTIIDSIEQGYNWSQAMNREVIPIQHSTEEKVEKASICVDCMYEPDNCNKTPEICEQEYKEIMGG